MVERSLSMREVPGSMPGSSTLTYGEIDSHIVKLTSIQSFDFINLSIFQNDNTNAPAIIFTICHVRMAERSKAPDSRVQSLPLKTKEHSGPRMWAWVRILLLTRIFERREWNGLQILTTSKVSTEPDLNQRPKDACFK